MKPQQIDDFFNMLLEYLYILPSKIDSIRLKVEGDNTKRNDIIKNMVLDTLFKMENEVDGNSGVDYDVIEDEVMEEGDIDKDEFENAVKELKGEGKIYEPVLGNLKRIY